MMNKKAISVCSIASLIVLANGMAACSGKPDDEVGASPKPAVEVAAVDVPQAGDILMSNGKRVFSSCASCHTVNKGGGSTIGPNL